MSEMVCRCAPTRSTTVRKWPTQLLVSSLDSASFVSIYSVRLSTCLPNWEIQTFQRFSVNTLHSRCFLRAQIFMESKEKTSRSRKLSASHLLSTRWTILGMIRKEVKFKVCLERYSCIFHTSSSSSSTAPFISTSFQCVLSSLHSRILRI